MDVVPLTPQPDLEHYVRLADALAAGEVDAAWLAAVGVPGDRFVQDSIDRALEALRAGPPATPAEARRLLARAHGFESWPDFARHVEGIAGTRSRRAPTPSWAATKRPWRRCSPPIPGSFGYPAAVQALAARGASVYNKALSAKAR